MGHRQSPLSSMRLVALATSSEQPLSSSGDELANDSLPTAAGDEGIGVKDTSPREM